MVEKDFLRLDISKVIIKVSLDKVVIFTPMLINVFFLLHLHFHINYYIEQILKILYQSNQTIKLIIPNLT